MTVSTNLSSLKPIYSTEPNMRFATTFLSNKYRDFAINGETLMDKATGEIFTKRPEDGRVVSFFQNKKYMSSLMLDLRVMLNNNADFRYPEDTDIDACYLSTDYDMMSINSEKDVNILTSNSVIPNTSNAVTKLQFRISKKSNGFFIRLTSRDSDKVIIEYLTNQYNARIKNYSDSNSTYITEKNKFSSIEKWADSNATVTYTVDIKTGSNTVTHTFTDYVRINEECGIIFPATITNTMLTKADTITVTIKSITYDKIQFMNNHKSEFGSEFTSSISKFIYPDNNIFIRYCNICSFVDSSNDILVHGNEFIIALMDIAYVRRYMMKMSKLTSESSVILSTSRPTDDMWNTNAVWAERLRDVFKGGYTTNLESEVNFKDLEMYLADNEDNDFVNISLTANMTDIYGKV